MRVLNFISILFLIYSCGSTESSMEQESEVTLTVDSVQHDSIPIFDSLTTDAYNVAWSDTNRPILIDAYGANAIDWTKMQTDKRVVAIIHKSSQGLNTAEKYTARRTKAKALGYLWGSYHLGTNDDPIQQADLYLKTIGDIDNEVIALDLEDISKPKFMNLENALIFIKYIHQKTGRYPFLYCNHSVMKAISRKHGRDSLFSKCPLWYARFTSKIQNFKNDTWSDYTFWQFSCELNCSKTGECLYNLPGTRYDMDVNVYFGSTAELKYKWGRLGRD